MTGEIRVGVIGAVWGERAHVPSIKDLPEFELAAICTGHPETAEAMKERTGAPKAYSDVSQLVQDPDIDLITISTRVPLHKPFAEAALNAGKHVFSEWPMALDVPEAQEMVRLAKDNNRIGSVGLQRRWSPVHMYLRHLVEDGYIGEVLNFSMNVFAPQYIQPTTTARWWLPIKEEGGNALTIAGGSAIDSLCWVLGDPAELAASVETRLKQWTWADTGETIDVTAPDTVMASIRLKSGALGSVAISRVSWHGSGSRLEIYGTKGSLHLLQGQGQGQILMGAKGGEELQELVPPSEFTFVPEIPQNAMYFAVAQTFRKLADAIKHGQEFNPDFGTALHLHRILESIERASAEKKWIRVELD